MNRFLRHNKNILAGQSVARSYMNVALSKRTLTGRVVDVGGGRDPDYFAYLQKQNVTSIEPIDSRISGIDFEVDPLPLENQSVDTVLCCNLLEHIYHHQFVLKEMHRITRKGGRLIGFVPFWVGYHPDPHDYFRYTRAALSRLLADAGFMDVSVEAVGGGPLIANLNTIILSFPKIIRPVLFMLYLLLDRVFVTLRPKSKERNPLGFVFEGTAV